MITTTVMRRVLAKLEAESLNVANRTSGLTTYSERAAHEGATVSTATLRLLQGDGVLIARMVKALNAETHTLADFRNMPADAKPRARGASSTACDDQHTTAQGV